MSQRPAILFYVTPLSSRKVFSFDTLYIVRNSPFTNLKKAYEGAQAVRGYVVSFHDQKTYTQQVSHNLPNLLKKAKKHYQIAFACNNLHVNDEFIAE